MHGVPMPDIAMRTIAERNLRAYLTKASFSSSVDRQAALECVEVLASPSSRESAAMRSMQEHAAARPSIPAILDANVSPANALRSAEVLEQAIDEVMNGKRRPEALPLEPMCRLIQYVRQQPAKSPSTLTDAQIRKIFLANGFTVKDGSGDLKPYVYKAARALLAEAKETSQTEHDMPPLPEPEAWLDMTDPIQKGYSAKQMRERDHMWQARLQAVEKAMSNLTPQTILALLRIAKRAAEARNEAIRLATELERDKWHVSAVTMEGAAQLLRRLVGNPNEW